MRKSASVISDRFLERVKSLDRYVQRIESLYGSGLMTQQDAERAYRGAYLEFHIGLEQAIETLFLGLLRGSLRSRSHRVHPRISVKSHRVASDVVRGANRFVDWLPYERTLQRAEVFFRGGRPFTSLTGQEKKELEDSTAIRNALAHESSAALKRFRTALVDGRNLPSRQHGPSGYLRGQHRAGQTRMNYRLAAGALVLQKLTM